MNLVVKKVRTLFGNWVFYVTGEINFIALSKKINKIKEKYRTILCDNFLKAYNFSSIIIIIFINKNTEFQPKNNDIKISTKLRIQYVYT